MLRGERSLSLDWQAQFFGRYIIGIEPSTDIVQRYRQAIGQLNHPLTQTDQKLLNLAGNSRWRLGIIDAGLARQQPNAELRQRLYIMVALLETSPEYHQYFLISEPSPGLFVRIILIGLGAGLKTILGGLLIRVVA